MVNFGLATDLSDAKAACYTAFEASTEYTKHENDLRQYLVDVVTDFSE
jgi:hypothetical protein